VSLSPAAQVQRDLWGRDPRTWADLAEPHNRPLFEAVLDAAAVGPGCRLLDVGCGSGLALLLAAGRGAEVSGIDVSPGLLGVARERLPMADLREAEMEALPFEDDCFDAVIGVNAFQFAADPVHAFREAARVVRPGGAVAASLFAAAELCESTVVHEAMAALSPPARAADHAPYALSAAGNLEAAMGAAGLAPTGSGTVECRWDYADLSDAVAGLLCSAGGARAVRDAGADRVRATLVRALEPFQRPDGRVVMRNTFRWVSAQRPWSKSR